MNDYIGFVYLWINNITGKKYIGSHQGKVDDGYIGSGTYFKRAINKYGIENFSRSVLYFEYNTIKGLYQKEYELINEYNAVLSNEFYNLCNISPNVLGIVEGDLRKVFSEEHKDKLREVAKNRAYSQETKAKMSKNSYIKGKRWYNNGSISKTFSDNEVPDGWVIGRIQSENTTKGYKFYTNGVESVSLPPDTTPPDGWYEGKHNNDKFSGDKNPAAVRIEVNGHTYSTIKEAIKDTGFCYEKVVKIGKRIK